MRLDNILTRCAICAIIVVDRIERSPFYYGRHIAREDAKSTIASQLSPLGGTWQNMATADDERLAARLYSVLDTLC